MNTWAQVAGLGVTETTVTMNKWLHTSGSSDLSAIGINNIRVTKKQNGMESSLKDLEGPKEFNKIDTDIPHIVSPFRNGP